MRWPEAGRAVSGWPVPSGKLYSVLVVTWLAAAVTGGRGGAPGVGKPQLRQCGRCGALMASYQFSAGTSYHYYHQCTTGGGQLANRTRTWQWPTPTAHVGKHCRRQQITAPVAPVSHWPTARAVHTKTRHDSDTTRRHDTSTIRTESMS